MNHARMRLIARVSVLLSALVIITGPAWAQDPGVRTGVSVDPDQFYLGAHLETDPLVDRLHFRPNIELGVGDDRTVLSANMEFVYKFPRRRLWGLYAGGGPTINVTRRDERTRTDAGVNLLVGAEQSSGLFFEFKFGVVDSPNLKFGVGWTFR